MDNHSEYVSPSITVVGSVEEMTAATKAGLYIDGTYPAGTPVAGHLS